MVRACYAEIASGSRNETPTCSVLVERNLALKSYHRLQSMYSSKVEGGSLSESTAHAVLSLKFSYTKRKIPPRSPKNPRGSGEEIPRTQGEVVEVHRRGPEMLCHKQDIPEKPSMPSRRVLHFNCAARMKRVTGRIQLGPNRSSGEA